MAMHRTHGVNVGIARIFNTYGPRLSPGDGRVVSNFIVQALRGEPLTVYGDGSQTRSLCLRRRRDRGPARPARLVAHRAGQHRQPRRAHRAASWPTSSWRCTGSASDIVFEPLPTDDPTRRCPDITLARRELGWEPTIGLREGIERTIDVLRRQGEDRAHDGRQTLTRDAPAADLPRRSR